MKSKISLIPDRYPFSTAPEPGSIIVTPKKLISPAVSFSLPLEGLSQEEQADPTFRAQPLEAHERLLVLWKRSVAILDKFWDYWRTEYLNSLRERTQRHVKQGATTPLEPSLGEVVIIHEPNLPRTFWKLGIIVNFRQSHPKQLKVAQVKTGPNKFLWRSINQLYSLEIVQRHPTAAAEQAGAGISTESPEAADGRQPVAPVPPRIEEEQRASVEPAAGVRQKQAIEHLPQRKSGESSNTLARSNRRAGLRPNPKKRFPWQQLISVVCIFALILPEAQANRTFVARNNEPLVTAEISYLWNSLVRREFVNNLHLVTVPHDHNLTLPIVVGTEEDFLRSSDKNVTYFVSANKTATELINWQISLKAPQHNWPKEHIFEALCTEKGVQVHVEPSISVVEICVWDACALHFPQNNVLQYKDANQTSEDFPFFRTTITTEFQEVFGTKYEAFLPAVSVKLWSKGYQVGTKKLICKTSPSCESDSLFGEESQHNPHCAKRWVFAAVVGILYTSSFCATQIGLLVRIICARKKDKEGSLSDNPAIELSDTELRKKRKRVRFRSASESDVCSSGSLDVSHSEKTKRSGRCSSLEPRPGLKPLIFSTLAVVLMLKHVPIGHTQHAGAVVIRANDSFGKDILFSGNLSLELMPFELPANIIFQSPEAAPVATVKILVVATKYRCLEQVSYWIRNFVPQKVVIEKECENCNSVSVNSQLARMFKGASLLSGYTSCSESAQHIRGVQTACTFSRTYLAPTDDVVGRLIKCGKWVPEVDALISFSRQSKQAVESMTWSSERTVYWQGLQMTLRHDAVTEEPAISDQLFCDDRRCSLAPPGIPSAARCLSLESAQRNKCVVNQTITESVVKQKDLSTFTPFYLFENETTMLPKRFDNFTVQLEDGHLFAFGHVANISLDISVPKLVIPIETKQPVKFRLLASSGCVKCHEAAVITYTCTTPTSSAVAHLFCPSAVIGIECGPEMKVRRARVVFDRQHLAEKCTLRTPRGETEVFMDGNLKQLKHVEHTQHYYYRLIMYLLFSSSFSIIVLYLVSILAGVVTASASHRLSRKLGTILGVTGIALAIVPQSLGFPMRPLKYSVGCRIPMPLHTDHSKNDSYWREFYDPCQYDHYNTSNSDTDSSSDESWGSAPGTPLRAPFREDSRSPSPPGYNDRYPPVAAVSLEDEQLIFVTEWLERRFNYMGSLEYYFLRQRREIDNTIAVQPVKDCLTMQWGLTVGLSTKTAYADMPGTRLSYKDFFLQAHSRQLTRPYLEMVELASGIFRPAEMLLIDRSTVYPPLTLRPNEAV